MVTVGPLRLSGGSTTLTRAPRGIRLSAGRRASTIGLDSSTRRFTVETMRSMVCIACSSLLNGAGQRSSLAGPLDVDGVVPVDHDLADAGVVEDRLEHTSSTASSTTRRTSLVASLADRMTPLAGDEVGDDALEPGPSPVGIDLAEPSWRSTSSRSMRRKVTTKLSSSLVAAVTAPPVKEPVVVHLITGIRRCGSLTRCRALTTVGTLTVTE